MITIAIILLVISVWLLMAALYYGLAYIRPGVYPPKQVLKSKLVMLGSTGGILLLIGITFFYFI